MESDWVISLRAIRHVPIFLDKIYSILIHPAESSPQALHIYTFPPLAGSTAPASVLPTSSAAVSTSPRLQSVLVHQRPVTRARWNPVRAGNLALACGAGALYTWSDEWIAEPAAGTGGREEELEMVECVGVPASECCGCVVGPKMRS